MTNAETRAAPVEIEDLDINRIMEVLPHRYPFLMIDKLVGIEPGVKAIGIKNVTINEPFFVGHFPIKPIMPGVMIIEAMAQTSAAFISYVEEFDMERRVVYFMSIDKARFRRPVEPGDKLELHVSLTRAKGPVRKFHGDAIVDGQLMAEADFAAMTVKV
ncbi:MAG: 3-hydroxyacyl-ACP dehydratase FabZ [Parvularculaceae bacterium]